MNGSYVRRMIKQTGISYVTTKEEVNMVKLFLFFIMFSNMKSIDNRVYPRGLRVPLKLKQSNFEKYLSALKKYTLFQSKFDNDTENWVISSGGWKIGVPQDPQTKIEKHGRIAFIDKKTSSIANPNPQVLKSPRISLPEIKQGEHLVLELRHTFDLEYYHDFGYIIVETKASTWDTIGKITGTSLDWQKSYYLLDKYAGNNVVIGFLFATDDSNNNDYWYIDDFLVLLYTPQDLQLKIITLNHSQFPWIYITAKVETSNISIDSLTLINFSVSENGILQLDEFQVTQPDTGNVQRAVDVVFLMDNSGSMSDEENAVANNVRNFTSNLEQCGVDYALGLIRFGALENGGEPIIENNGQLVSDCNYFINNLWGKNVTDGGFEPGWDAIVAALQNVNFRPGALKVLILITDETPHDDGNTGQYAYSDALNALSNSGALLFAMINLSEPHAYDDYGTLAVTTGGKYYYISDPMDDILNDISNAVMGNYIIRYKTQDTLSEGLREVILTVRAFGIEAADTTYYAKNSHICITLSDSTTNLLSTSQPFNAPLTIGAIIKDFMPPYVNNVQLYYRNVRNAVFKNMRMIKDSLIDTLWKATIPVNEVDTPGIAFYLTASDSLTSVSLPASFPQQNPFVIAIYPNYVPFIFHYNMSTFLKDTFTILTAIYDITNHVDSANVFIRREGEVIWEKKDLELVGSYTISDYCNMIENRYGISKDTVKDALLQKAQQHGLNLNENTIINIFAYQMYNDTKSIQTFNYYLVAYDDYGTIGMDGTQSSPYKITFASQVYKYAPVLQFSPGEEYFPIDVESFLSHCNLVKYKGCYPNEDATIVSSNVKITDLQKGGFLTLKYFYTPDDNIDLHGKQVGYYNICENNSQRVIQYWFLFPYNNFLDIHEGDWEVIELVFDKNDPEHPKTVLGSAHIGFTIASWDNVIKSGTHPIVKVAKGSHAMYTMTENFDRLLTMINEYISNGNICSGTSDVTVLLKMIKDLLEGAGRDVDTAPSILSSLILYFGCEKSARLITFLYYNVFLSPQEKINILETILALFENLGNGKEIEPSLTSMGTDSYVLKPINNSWSKADIYWGSKWTRSAEYYSTISLPIDLLNDVAGGIVTGLPYGDYVFYTSGPISPLHPSRGEPGHIDVFIGDEEYGIGFRMTPWHKLVFDLNNDDLAVGYQIVDKQTYFLSKENTGEKEIYKIPCTITSYSLEGHKIIIIDFYEPADGNLIIKNLTTNTINWQVTVYHYSKNLKPDTYYFTGSLFPHETDSIPVKFSTFASDTSLVLTQSVSTLTNTNIYSYPNPFNPEKEYATIRYAISEETKLTIKIYDLTNHLIRTLKDNEVEHPGEHAIFWDGRNNSGKIVANGVYLLLVEASNGHRALTKIAVKR